MLQALRFFPDWILLVLQLGGLALLLPGLGRTVISAAALSGILLALLNNLGWTEPLGHFAIAFCSVATCSAAVAGWIRGSKKWNLRYWRQWISVRENSLTLVFLGAALAAWTFWLGDTDGLPSHHDGVVHSAFFVRLWEQGAFPLTAGHMTLAQTFGTEAFQNYPAGAHILANLLSLPHRLLLAPLGATTADFLKATLILVCAGLPPLVFRWGLRVVPAIRRQLTPQRVQFAAAIAAVASLTYFRFPITAADQGGWSRLFALVWVWLWAGEVLFSASPRSKNLRAWPLVLLGAFFFHPQAFIAACLSLACYQIWEHQTLRERVAWIGGVLGVLTVGWWLAPYHQSSTELGQIFPAKATSLANVLDRISFLIGQSIFGEPQAREFSVLSRRFFGAFGLLYLLVRPRTPHARWVLTWLGALTVISLTLFLPWPQLRFLGAPLYHQTDRMAEIFYLPLAVSWCVGAAILLSLPSGHKRARWTPGVNLIIFLLLAQGLGWKAVIGVPRVKEHFRHFGSVHLSPRFSIDGDAIQKLRERLDGQPTLLVAAPDVTDSWPFRLPADLKVQSLFTFGECPIGGAEVGIHFDGHCARRKAFYDRCRTQGCPEISGVKTLFISRELPRAEP